MTMINEMERIVQEEVLGCFVVLS